VLALSWIFGLSGCSSDVKEPTVPTYKTQLSKGELKSSAYGKEFPQQWTLYQRNTQANDQEALKTMTMFKGSVPFRKHDDQNPLPKGFKQAAQPYLKNLWLGYPFSFEYNEARGHTYALNDILEIDRINRVAYFSLNTLKKFNGNPVQ
jgi:nitrite reductase (cytochrome c-552)